MIFPSLVIFISITFLPRNNVNIYNVTRFWYGSKSTVCIIGIWDTQQSINYNVTFQAFLKNDLLCANSGQKSKCGYEIFNLELPKVRQNLVCCQDPLSSVWVSWPLGCSKQVGLLGQLVGLLQMLLQERCKNSENKRGK